LILKALVVAGAFYLLSRFVRQLLLPPAQKSGRMPHQTGPGGHQQPIIEICPDCGEDLTGRNRCKDKLKCPNFKA
jgi:hypothetical protein